MPSNPKVGEYYTLGIGKSLYHQSKSTNNNFFIGEDCLQKYVHHLKNQNSYMTEQR